MTAITTGIDWSLTNNSASSTSTITTTMFGDTTNDGFMNDPLASLGIVDTTKQSRQQGDTDGIDDVLFFQPWLQE